MDEAINANGILIGTMSGAMVVVAGGFYALLFALGRIHKSQLMSFLSLVCYALLVLFSYLLSQSLNLSGFWIFVIVVMLVGYYFAPRGIWHLCVGTHQEAEKTANQEIPGAF